MTITTTYSATQTHSTVTAYSLGLPSAQSAITTLSGGGWAMAVQDSQGYTEMDLYSPNGTPEASATDFHATDAKITQLTNGNILVAGTTPTGSVDYRIYNQLGQDVGAGTFGRDTNAANVSVIATAGGGFTAVYQKFYAAGADHDIYYQGFNATGGSIGAGAVDGTSANDQNGAIAQLAGGNYVIAWDRTDNSTGNTSIYYEVLSSNFGVVKAETLFDDGGTTNKTPSVTALQNGGFALTYEDSSFNSGGIGPGDIVQYDFNATGGVVGGGRMDNLIGEDSQPASATLSDGTVLTAFTNAFNATDNDIDIVASDPVTGAPLGTSTGLPGADLGVNESNAAITAMANDQFAVSYTLTTASATTSEFATYVLTRTTNGDDAGDTIVGDAKRDVITTGSGNDTITPGDGAGNQVSAGLGYDTVIFSGARASYTITRSGLITGVNGPDGSSNSLTGVEKLEFSDQNFFLPPPVRDFGGNGASDLLLQNTDGRIALWQMNGTAVVSTDVESSNPGAVWQVKGSGDFNGDSYADILLQNTSSGAINIWEMNGATRLSATTLTSNAGPTWQAITTGDFNGDGKADILLQNTSGQAAVWLMDGTNVATKSVLTNPGSTWHAIATGDFNADGHSDILWQNSTDGSIQIWTMNGGTVVSQSPVSTSPGTAWHVKAAGDFNGDGKADIVMQNDNGGVVVWLMNGTTVTSKTMLTNNPGASWQVTGVGDYNGDGKADIALQNSSGAIAVWTMNSTTITATSVLPNNPGTSWHLVAGTGG